MASLTDSEFLYFSPFGEREGSLGLNLSPQAGAVWVSSLEEGQSFRTLGKGVPCSWGWMGVGTGVGCECETQESYRGVVTTG